nr:UvrD-helicase domain-containing protein [Myxococcota bacterium]
MTGSEEAVTGSSTTELASAAVKVPADAAARARIRDDHASSLLVEAAAGTGKTTALVTRLVSMLRSGACELRGVVAVTFTDKAAGELTLRVRGALESARLEAASDEERGRCERALEQLETARVGTIHGFCTDLLRERPVEAGVDPTFAVLAEDETSGLIERAIGEVLESALSAPSEGLRRLVRRVTREQETARERLRDAVRTLIEHRDHDAPWRREPFDRDAEVDAVMLEIGELAELSEHALNPSDWCAKSLLPLARFAADVGVRERAAPRDHDGLEATLADLLRRKEWNWKGTGKMFAPGVLRADVIARRDALRARIERFLEQADADLAACLRRDLQPMVERYEELKRRIGALDFLDLLLGVRRMLVEQEGVRRELQARFTHLFVDELQDTDPVQAEIVLLLSSDDPRQSDPAQVRPTPGKLFLVGDPKQSIYRFRRADIATYERVKAQLVGHGVPVLHLTTSFRSLPAIQRVVNAAFGPAMELAAPGTQAQYVGLTEWREPEPRRPSVIALGIPRPYERTDRIAKSAIESSTPDAVAAFVAWLVQESGWLVVDPATGLWTPVAPRHVCLLFRRQQGWNGTDVVQPYVRGLEARRVPHVWAFGRSFHEREEIVGLRSVAAAIEYPDDALAVYATLRGAFLALTDADLLLYRDRVGSLHPMRKVDPATVEPALRPVAEALALLRELHLGRNRHPIADTFARFFDATRAHASLALAHGGEQLLASAMRILDMARRFDQRGALSFRGFATLLEAQAERGEGGGDATPSGEEGQEGVRVMTVHKAKGLEFPVVVLCDPTASTGGFADRSIDATRREAFFPLAKLKPIELRERADAVIAANQAEIVRVTYVAATRARDLLVVPACGDAPFEEGWLAVLNRAIYPEASERRQGEGRAPGCPQFGDDSVRTRSFDAEAAGVTSVRPGLHRSLGVVWWDPATLQLDAEPADGLRSEDVLRATPGVDDGTRAHRAWTEARAAAIEDGALPSIAAKSVRALARLPRDGSDGLDGEQPGDAPHVERVEGVQRGARPTGRRIDALF